MRIKTKLCLLATGLMLSAPAMAEQGSMAASAAPACPAPIAPAGALAPWARPAPLAAGADGAHAPTVTLGRAAQLALLPTPSLHFLLPPAKSGEATSHGGVLSLDIAKTGTYRIALSAAAWLDVVGQDGAQRSIAHAHGPDCSGIRKMVDFTLKPGHYTVQISSSAVAQIRLLAIALP
ncbi:MAG: homogentisate 1,2-dioxygenase [Sphingomonadales bacterium]|nr:homogentisate 1,2-dioxygenase [Sphingomonadales bacterium]MDE2168687.1 homogentisate 1,2-dioxygenase [Sphingomonadales bacterium]